MSDAPLRTARDRRRDAIIDVAREVFFEEGYAAASMSSIAARLGGSKGTLYNYFRSKDELFEAQVREGCERAAKETFDLLTEERERVANEPFDLQTEERTLEEQLALLGERFLTMLYTDWVVRTYRMVVAETIRSPHIARIFYEAGPAIGVRRLETYLREAVERGLVKIEDCHVAAGEYLNLCRGHHHFLFVLDLVEAASPEQIRTQARHAASMFVKAYAA
jgi:AcrR family transcriptional regulator